MRKTEEEEMMMNSNSVFIIIVMHAAQVVSFNHIQQPAVTHILVFLVEKKHNPNS